MQKLFSKITLFTILILILIPFFHIQAHEAEQAHVEETEAVIYYNEACGMCATYVNTEIEDMLSPYGITDYIKKDYVSERSNRPEMNQIMTDLGVPLPLQSHIMTFVDDKYILGGHVPKHIIDDLFQEENSKKFKRIIIYQDKICLLYTSPSPRDGLLS